MKIMVLINRIDLRLRDNPAFYQAVKNGSVLPVFILDRETYSFPSSAKDWWFHQALQQFIQQLESIGGQLYIQKGDTETIVLDLIKKHRFHAVFWNRCYEPTTYMKAQRLAKQLEKLDITVKTFEGQLLLTPWQTRKPDGSAYKVFTPFYKGLEKQAIPAPLSVIDSLQMTNFPNDSLSINELELLPTGSWTNKLASNWIVSEQEALKQLEKFTHIHLRLYKDHRDLLVKNGPSRLSPYIANGQISVRTIYHYIQNSEIYGETFLRQLAWREFSWHILFHFPETITQPLNEKFSSFRWLEDEQIFDQWKRGKTGYPLVDAGMRELWETGYMHNRVRMVVASFLTKHLLIHWSKGMQWFHDTLVDADLGNNIMGWQWTAGSGADAAPYFRVFNPTLQGQKFDAEGEYIKRWIPELRKLSPKYIHTPSKAPTTELSDAGISIGQNYPAPIVDHQAARIRALEHYEEIK